MLWCEPATQSLRTRIEDLRPYAQPREWTDISWRVLDRLDWALELIEWQLLHLRMLAMIFLTNDQHGGLDAARDLINRVQDLRPPGLAEVNDLAASRQMLYFPMTPFLWIHQHCISHPYDARCVDDIVLLGSLESYYICLGDAIPLLRKTTERLAATAAAYLRLASHVVYFYNHPSEAAGGHVDVGWSRQTRWAELVRLNLWSEEVSISLTKETQCGEKKCGHPACVPQRMFDWFLWQKHDVPTVEPWHDDGFVFVWQPGED